MRKSFPATLALTLASVAALAGPARAAELAAVIGTQGSARDVQLVGVLAYVADGAGGLRLFDLTDPGSPAPLGSLPPLAGGSALAVEVIGTRAYVANGDPGVQIVDVSDPALPIARWRARGWITEIRQHDLALEPAEAFAEVRKLRNRHSRLTTAPIHRLHRISVHR